MCCKPTLDKILDRYTIVPPRWGKVWSLATKGAPPHWRRIYLDKKRKIDIRQTCLIKFFSSMPSVKLKANNIRLKLKNTLFDLLFSSVTCLLIDVDQEEKPWKKYSGVALRDLS